jgi:hypothetical protein
MTGGSDGQSDEIKADRSHTEILFETTFRGEQIQFSFNFLDDYCHINACMHNSLHYVHSMCIKTNSLHSQHRKTLQGYLDQCERISRPLFYQTNAVCHNPLTFQRRCVALHTTATVYTTCYWTECDKQYRKNNDPEIVCS